MLYIAGTTTQIHKINKKISTRRSVYFQVKKISFFPGFLFWFIVSDVRDAIIKSVKNVWGSLKCNPI